jgi:hypothetical protein
MELFWVLDTLNTQRKVCCLALLLIKLGSQKKGAKFDYVVVWWFSISFVYIYATRNSFN